MNYGHDDNGRFLVGPMVNFTPPVKALVYHGQFTGNDVMICKHFGCRKRLSLPESLAGSLCTHHMNIKPINITSTIKKP